MDGQVAHLTPVVSAFAAAVASDVGSATLAFDSPFVVVIFFSSVFDDAVQFGGACLAKEKTGQIVLGSPRSNNIAT